jgi:hypothetical protein
MTYDGDAPRSIRSLRGQRHRVLALLGATLVLLGACAPRATVRGVDPIAAALREAAEWVDTTPVRPVANRRLAGSGATGAQLMRSTSAAGPVPQFTAHAATPRSTAATGSTTATPAPVGALVGAAWVGHYATSGPAPRTALGLALRESAGRESTSVQDVSLTGELLLWAAPSASVFDGADARRASGRVVRVPLAGARYAAGQLRMTTEPFLDPACGCTVHGVFTGAVHGDTLAGRFTLVGASTVAPRGGRWALVRRAER